MKSFKLRISAVIVLMVLFGTTLVTITALKLAERKMRAIVGAQQYALLASTAAHIDADLRARQTLLAVMREEMEAARPEAAQLQPFLEAHPNLREEFFNVLVFSPSGKVIANLKDRRAVNAQDFSGRHYFIDTVRSKEGVISRPFRSALSGQPVVLVTEPVYGADGQLRFILGGAIDLQRPRSFGQLSAVSIGSSGYLFMLTTDGTIIHHPQQSRILQNVTREPGGAVAATADQRLRRRTARRVW